MLNGSLVVKRDELIFKPFYLYAQSVVLMTPYEAQIWQNMLSFISGVVFDTDISY